MVESTFFVFCCTGIGRVAVNHRIRRNLNGSIIKVANLKALKLLKLLGVAPDTPSPEGGKIGVSGGTLTGYMEENAYFQYVRRVPTAGPAELMESYKKAQQKYLSYGITTIQEGMFVSEMIPLYRALLASGALKADLVAYPELKALDEAELAFPEHVKNSLGHFKIGGLKIFLDGSPQGRTAWMRAPYEGGEDYRGYGTLSDGEVRNAMTASAKRNMQLLAHCNGDAAIQQFLDCLESCENIYPNLRRLRPVIIHAQLMGPDQIPRAAALGAMASFFAAHVWYWGDVHLKNFGRLRASRISPAALALAEGLPFTFHQDAPVVEPDMLKTVWCAAGRLTRGGVILGDEQRISVYEALRAVTSTAAFQYFEEDDKGSLRPGKRADLVLLERSPLAAPVAEVSDIKVLAAVKDGETVYTRGN